MYACMQDICVVYTYSTIAIFIYGYKYSPNLSWLTSNPNLSDGSSYCKLCKTALRAHKRDLEKHANTKNYKNWLPCVKICNNMCCVKSFS